MAYYKAKKKEARKIGTAWMVFGLFFLVTGLVFYINSLGITPVSDSNFNQMQISKSLPITAVAESNLMFARYGSLGLVITSLVFFAIGGYSAFIESE